MKLLVAAAAALALLVAAPAAAEGEEGCKNCPHHKAAAAKADGASAGAKAAPGDARAAPADPKAAQACACKKGDPNAKCACEPGQCACAKEAGHEAGHDCPMHQGEKAAAKGATKA